MGILEISDLTKDFWWAYRQSEDVDVIRVQEGSISGLIGPNGGQAKNHIFNLITGIYMTSQRAEIAFRGDPHP